MVYAIMFAISVHVLSGVFWAGSTFTLARGGILVGSQLFRPQMGAAAIAVLSGTYLWSQLHDANFGTAESVLALGAGCAVLAAGFQGAFCGPAIRALGNGTLSVSRAEARMAIGHRIGSGLLAITIVCMVISRYV